MQATLPRWMGPAFGVEGDGSLEQRDAPGVAHLDAAWMPAQQPQLPATHHQQLYPHLSHSGYRLQQPHHHVHALNDVAHAEHREHRDERGLNAAYNPAWVTTQHDAHMGHEKQQAQPLRNVGSSRGGLQLKVRRPALTEMEALGLTEASAAISSSNNYWNTAPQRLETYNAAVGVAVLRTCNSGNAGEPELPGVSVVAEQAHCVSSAFEHFLSDQGGAVLCSFPNSPTSSVLFHSDHSCDLSPIGAWNGDGFGDAEFAQFASRSPLHSGLMGAAPCGTSRKELEQKALGTLSPQVFKTSGSSSSSEVPFAQRLALCTELLPTENGLQQSGTELDGPRGVKLDTASGHATDGSTVSVSAGEAGAALDTAATPPSLNRQDGASSVNKKKRHRSKVPKGPPQPKKLGRVSCRNCGCHVTPQWRCGPEGPRTLCNACGVRYKKGLPLQYMEEKKRLQQLQELAEEH